MRATIRLVSKLLPLLVLASSPGLARADDGRVATGEAPAAGNPAPRHEPAPAAGEPAPEGHGATPSRAAEDAEETPRANTIPQEKSTRDERELAGGSSSIDGSVAPDASAPDGALAVDTELSTGTATSTYRLALPPGRAAMAPALALQYQSAGRDGWVGLGWDLEIGAIRRDTDFGLDYGASDFTVESSGAAQDLVHVAGNSFRAKIESAFTRYVFDPASNAWTATTRDGIRYRYGASADTRQENSFGTFRWCLDRVEEPNGNFMTVAYVKDHGQIYPQRIDYTGNATLAPASAVLFHLEERPDWHAVLETQDVVETRLRLKTVEVRALGQGARAYALSYVQSTASGRSLLAAIQQFGHDYVLDGTGGVASGSSLPPVSLEYTPEGDRLGDDHAWGGYDEPRDDHLPQGGYADFDGDGRVDFVYRPEHTDALHVLLSNGHGFDREEPWGIIEHPVETMLPPPSFVDVSGDGRADFVYRKDGTREIYVKLSSGSGFAREQRWVTLSTGMAGDCPRPAWEDMNGDGLKDLVYHAEGGTGRDFAVLVSSGSGFTETPAGRFAGSVSQSHPRPSFRDFNGDGRVDFAYRNDGSETILVMLSDGSRFTGPQPWGTHRHEAGQGHPPALFQDMNGDGRADLIYRESGTRSFYTLLSTGTRFLEEVPWGSYGGESGETLPSPLFIDMNGDGLADFVRRLQGSQEILVKLSTGRGFGDERPWGTYSFDAAQGPASPDFVDVTGDGRPDFVYRPLGELTLRVLESDRTATVLLSKTGNGIGGTTTIAYTASTAYENTRLPFAVQTVSSVTVADGIGAPQTTRTSYEGGLHDRVTREFRGFATAWEVRPDTTTRESRFLQDEQLRGKLRWEFVRDPLGSLLASTSSEWYSGPYVLLARRYAQELGGSSPVVRAVEYVYDAVGNLETETSYGSLGETSTIRRTYLNYGLATDPWIWRKHTESLEDSTGRVVRLTTYDHEMGTGNKRTETRWNDSGPDAVVRYTYEPNGNLLAVVSPRGVSTTYLHDTSTATFLSRVVYPTTSAPGLPPGGGVPHVVEYPLYDYRLGLPRFTKDENGQATAYTYDPFGRLIRIAYPDGGEIAYEFRDDVFPRERVTRIKAVANGPTIDTVDAYDGLGRLLQTLRTGEGGRVIAQRTRFDAMGRPDLQEGPFFAARLEYPAVPLGPDHAWTSTEYDFHGRPRVVRNPDGRHGTVETTYAYDGLTAVAADADLSVRKLTRDFRDRLIRVEEIDDLGVAHTTRYTYDVAGSLVSLSGPAGSSAMGYNTLGQRLDVSDPDMGTWHYTYDLDGNVRTQLDARGQLITFDTDDLGRLTRKTYSTGEPDVVLAYDDTTVPNARGRLTSVTSAAAVTRFLEYDDMGRLLRFAKAITGAPATYETRYRYDLAGRLEAIVYPDAYEVRYSYHPGSDLLRDAVGSDARVFATLGDYAPTGKLGTLAHGNGVVTTYTYDPLSTRLTSLETVRTGPSGSTPLQQKSYLYTRAGDVEERGDPLRGTTYRYTYDAQHRLRTERDQSNAVTVDYAYAASGNIERQTIAGETYDYRYDPGSPAHGVSFVALGSAGYDYLYDPNGNTTLSFDFANTYFDCGTYPACNPGCARVDDPRDPARGTCVPVGLERAVPVRRLTYDAENRPIRIQYDGLESLTMELAYDGEGMRVKKEVPGQGTTFYVGEHFEVANGVPQSYVMAGALRVAELTPSAVRFFHKDHLGSTTVTTDLAGNAVASTEFQPFGRSRDEAGTPVCDHAFTDQELDRAVGLYNMRARLYDPSIGRFLTPDAFVPSAVDPQALNRYSYVNNNPLAYTDPSGHFLQFVAAGFLYGAISGGLGSDWDLDVMFRSGVAGAAAATAGGLTAGLGPTWSGAAAGAVSGASNAAFFGGDVLRGALEGARTGAIGGAVFAFVPNMTAGAGRAMTQGVAGGIASKLTGGSFEEGFGMSAGTALLGWASLEMREAMVAQSSLDANNCSGSSAGWRDTRYEVTGRELDAKKTAGNRFRLDGPLKPSFLGGLQGGQGSIFGFLYWKGSPADLLVESFAGPHDWLNSWRYNSQGNNHTLPFPLDAIGAVMGGLTVPVAGIFQASDVISFDVPTLPLVGKEGKD